MTREEAIKELERLLSHWDDLENGKRSFRWYSKAAVEVALTALRPISREQVEKVFPGCKHCTKIKTPFCYDGANDSVYLLTGNGIAAIESDSWGFFISYCPHCGRPLTDEAVQMVIERMEALHENIYNG